MKRKICTIIPAGGVTLLLLLFFTAAGYGQQTNSIELNSLSDFADPADNWQMAGSVTASPYHDNLITVADGNAVLVNNPGEQRGEDLFTELEHGDIDLELEYMMPKSGNSGIYLQGRYELQLHDSWNVQVPSSANNGGIYERGADVQGDRQGIPPRQNASRAPGLWQHLEISFRAPRFNERGEKIENARILRAELNGVLIHDNVELMGPTAGAWGEGEVARGPLRIQGDHSAIALRNIKLKRYDRSAPSVSGLEYDLYGGLFPEIPDTDTMNPDKSGAPDRLTANLGTLPEQFLLHYRGTLTTPEAGSYEMNLNVTGGAGVLVIDGTRVVGLGSNSGNVTLPEGELPFEFYYLRRGDWRSPGFALQVSADGLRPHMLSEEPLIQGGNRNPIYLHANEKPLLRSFRDLASGNRISHAVSVSSLDKVHYTYDLNRGSLPQVWRGEFLNVTPMWYSRGDGSSRPNGSVENLLEYPALAAGKLLNRSQPWKTDTVGTGYRSKGYTLDDRDRPTFHYEIYGTGVEDRIRVIEEGKGVRRSIALTDIAKDLYFRLAEGKTISKAGENLYLVDDQSYYIRIEEAGGQTPEIRTVEGRDELILSAQSQIIYTILF